MSKNHLLMPMDEAAQIIHVDGGKPTTTSKVIAEAFGKRHDRVLRAIDNLQCSVDFRHRNFGETSNIVSMPNGGTRTDRSYTITRDGFSFLAMGFTGKKAAEWKERFIAAFNQMEQELIRQAIQKQNSIWIQARQSGKVARLELTDAVQEFVEYAHKQGSTNAHRYYSSITMMEYRALFMIGRAVEDGFRDKLSALQSSHLTTAESIAQRALREGMTNELHYKDIYTLAKERVEQFAAMIGKSHPGDGRPALEAA